MWLHLPDGFLSIVAHKTQPNALLVRARLPGHIESILPFAIVTEGGGTDYRYRTVIDKLDLIHVLSSRIRTLKYTNFKDSIPDSEEAYHTACMGCWSVMHRAQKRIARGGSKIEENDLLGIAYDCEWCGREQATQEIDADFLCDGCAGKARAEA